MGQGWVLLDNPDNVASEVGVITCKLICKGGKDVFELPSVEVIPGTEEAGTKKSIIGNQVRE